MKRFKNILMFADGAATGGSALKRAVDLARSNEARLTVMDVLDESDSPAGVEQRFGVDLNDILREKRQGILSDMVAPYQSDDTIIYTRVASGHAFVEVIRAVLRNGHDLLIKAAGPTEGLPERLLGSTDMHLLRKCPCPVWIDRSDDTVPYRQILAAVDPMAEEDGGTSSLIMALATSLAVREDAGLAVVHAWRLYGESLLRSSRARISNTEVDMLAERTRQLHRTRLDGLLGNHGLQVHDPRVHLVNEEPAPGIRQVAESVSADLIVMGTVGRTGIPGFFIGNTAEDVLQSVHASILAVKPSGFVSPVTVGAS